MTGAVDPVLKRELDALALPGLLVGHHVIVAGDENALRPGEAASLKSRLPEARRASGAARVVARELLSRLGLPEAEIPKGAGGEPVWPQGVVGSLAHDKNIAIAAVGLQRDFASIGVDIEPALELPADMLELIATPSELRALDGDMLKARLLFAAKEAVYKAAYRLDESFLEFTDIEVDFATRTATTCTGHTLSLRTCVSTRIVVIAFMAAAQA